MESFIAAKALARRRVDELEWKLEAYEYINLRDKVVADSYIRCYNNNQLEEFEELLVTAWRCFEECKEENKEETGDDKYVIIDDKDVPTNDEKESLKAESGEDERSFCEADGDEDDRSYTENGEDEDRSGENSENDCSYAESVVDEDERSYSGSDGNENQIVENCKDDDDRSYPVNEDFEDERSSQDSGEELNEYMENGVDEPPVTQGNGDAPFQEPFKVDLSKYNLEGMEPAQKQVAQVKYFSSDLLRRAFTVNIPEHDEMYGHTSSERREWIRMISGYEDQENFVARGQAYQERDIANNSMETHLDEIEKNKSPIKPIYQQKGESSSNQCDINQDTDKREESSCKQLENDIPKVNIRHGMSIYKNFSKEFVEIFNCIQPILQSQNSFQQYHKTAPIIEEDQDPNQFEHFIVGGQAYQERDIANSSIKTLLDEIEKNKSPIKLTYQQKGEASSNQYGINQYTENREESSCKQLENDIPKVNIHHGMSIYKNFSKEFVELANSIQPLMQSQNAFQQYHTTAPIIEEDQDPNQCEHFIARGQVYQERDIAKNSMEIRLDEIEKNKSPIEPTYQQKGEAFSNKYEVAGKRDESPRQQLENDVPKVNIQLEKSANNLEIVNCLQPTMQSENSFQQYEKTAPIIEEVIDKVENLSIEKLENSTPKTYSQNEMNIGVVTSSEVGQKSQPIKKVLNSEGKVERKDSPAPKGKEPVHKNGSRVGIHIEKTKEIPPEEKSSSDSDEPAPLPEHIIKRANEMIELQTYLAKGVVTEKPVEEVKPQSVTTQKKSKKQRQKEARRKKQEAQKKLNEEKKLKEKEENEVLEAAVRNALKTRIEHIENSLEPYSPLWYFLFEVALWNSEEDYSAEDIEDLSRMFLHSRIEETCNDSKNQHIAMKYVKLLEDDMLLPPHIECLAYLYMIKEDQGFEDDEDIFIAHFLG